MEQENIDAEKVKKDLISLLNASMNQSSKGGVDPRYLDNARFAITAWLDEYLMSNPSIDPLEWSTELLQKHFYGTSQAGKEFFQRLEQNMGRVDVLEVYYACLSLGFKGMYCNKEDAPKLADISTACFQNIETERGNRGDVIKGLREEYSKMVSTNSGGSFYQGEFKWWMLVGSIIVGLYVYYQYLLNQMLATITL